MLSPLPEYLGKAFLDIRGGALGAEHCRCRRIWHIFFAAQLLAPAQHHPRHGHHKLQQPQHCPKPKSTRQKFVKLAGPQVGTCRSLHCNFNGDSSLSWLRTAADEDSRHLGCQPVPAVDDSISALQCQRYADVQDRQHALGARPLVDDNFLQHIGLGTCHRHSYQN